MNTKYIASFTVASCAFLYHMRLSFYGGSSSLLWCVVFIATFTCMRYLSSMWVLVSLLQSFDFFRWFAFSLHRSVLILTSVMPWLRAVSLVVGTRVVYPSRVVLFFYLEDDGWVRWRFRCGGILCIRGGGWDGVQWR